MAPPSYCARALAYQTQRTDEWPLMRSSLLAMGQPCSIAVATIMQSAGSARVGPMSRALREAILGKIGVWTSAGFWRILYA